MKTTKFVAMGDQPEIISVSVTLTESQEISIRGKLTKGALEGIVIALRVAARDKGAEVIVHSDTPIDGTSCSLAVAMAAYAELEGITLSDDKVYSGSVFFDGTVAKPGDALAKRKFVESLGYTFVQGGTT